MTEVWASLRRERGLVRYGVLMFALLVIAAGLWAVDGRVVREVNVWAKPMKFMAATACLALTTAVFLALLPTHARAQHFAKPTTAIAAHSLTHSLDFHCSRKFIPTLM